jgi:glucose-1-phosphate adenylyltransferase
MKTMGIIFSNIHNETIDELTRKRTSASIPFGGRYRLIDFALSNMVNADIINVGVITQKNYQSLMDHVGSGKDWDLSRKNGGLVVFPPFKNSESDFLFTNRLEALKSISEYISNDNADYVVLSDCDSVNVVDYTDVINRHIENEADITVIYQNLQVPSDMVNHMSLELDDSSRVIHADRKSQLYRNSNVSLNIWVMNRKLLEGLLEEATVSGASSFERDVIQKNVKSLKIYGYNYEGVYLHVNTMENYYKYNMQLLNAEVRSELFAQPGRAIYTKVRDSAPTRYGKDSLVENCFIADGCEIEGTVRNSILFRGVKVAKGSVVENSILMQDTMVSSSVRLNCVITDMNVTIRDRNELSGCEKVPYYIGKNSVI